MGMASIGYQEIEIDFEIFKFEIRSRGSGSKQNPLFGSTVPKKNGAPYPFFSTVGCGAKRIKCVGA